MFVDCVVALNITALSRANEAADAAFPLSIANVLIANAATDRAAVA